MAAKLVARRRPRPDVQNEGLLELAHRSALPKSFVISIDAAARGTFAGASLTVVIGVDLIVRSSHLGTSSHGDRASNVPTNSHGGCGRFTAAIGRALRVFGGSSRNCKRQTSMQPAASRVYRWHAACKLNPWGKEPICHA